MRTVRRFRSEASRTSPISSTRVRSTENPGLALYRLREIAEEHPEAKELLPPPVDMNHVPRASPKTSSRRGSKRSRASRSPTSSAAQEDELQVIVDPGAAGRAPARRSPTFAVRWPSRTSTSPAAISGKASAAGSSARWAGSAIPSRWPNASSRASAGPPVYVRDVAEVKLGYKKPDGIVRRFGTSVIAINCLRRTGTNVLRGAGRADARPSPS